MTLGESYGKYKGRGATPREALLGGSLETAIEIATEMGPMGTIMKKLGGQIGLRKFITELFAREVVGEQVATLGQELVDTMIANPDKSLRDYMHEIPRNAYQTLIATLTQTTIISWVVQAREPLTCQGADSIRPLVLTMTINKPRKHWMTRPSSMPK
jgi:hypothetical protein